MFGTHYDGLSRAGDGSGQKNQAGYTLGGADILVTAMEEKPEEMAKQREIFAKGAKDTNQIEAKEGNDIFNILKNSSIWIQQISLAALLHDQLPNCIP